MKRKEFDDITIFRHPTLTVGDQVETVKQMLINSLRGKEYQTFEGRYEDNPDIDNPDPMNGFGIDLIDAAQLTGKYQYRVNEIREELLAQQQQSASKEASGSESNPDEGAPA